MFSGYQMPKRGAIQLTTGFLVVIILSVAVFGMGIYFVQKIHSSADRRIDLADQQANREMRRLSNAGEKTGLAPQRIEGKGIISLVIANDASVDSNKFGFKVSYDTCFSGPCGAVSPIDWITYTTKGSENRPIEIRPYKSREFLIAVNPKGNSEGTYVFDVEVRYDSNMIGNSIEYSDSRMDEDELYKSLLKFYVKV